MGDQADRILAQISGEWRQRVVEHHIGVEIKDQVRVTLLLDQAHQRAALHRGAKLHDIVLEDPAAVIAQILGQPDLGEGLGSRIEPIGRGVVEAKGQACLRFDRGQAFGQDAGLRQIVHRRAGIDRDLHAAASVESQARLRRVMPSTFGPNP